MPACFMGLVPPIRVLHLYGYASPGDPGETQSPAQPLQFTGYHFHGDGDPQEDFQLATCRTTLCQDDQRAGHHQRYDQKGYFGA
ncbi:hypothetical protein [Microbulbifer yueqingensis]|uniref:hypothetical protein n=1 Tax=Microbulbifer yueqingensis TaxID=658219 RepID=UPI000B897C6B|nr:hypothetical protein [Microbulbifer yueqingensis]